MVTRGTVTMGTVTAGMVTEGMVTKGHALVVGGGDAEPRVLRELRQKRLLRRISLLPIIILFYCINYVSCHISSLNHIFIYQYPVV